MKYWKIPVTWEAFGFARVEAETLEEAIKKFDNDPDSIPLPTDSDYVDGSFERELDVDLIKFYNGITVTE